MDGFIAFIKKEIMHIKRDPVILFFCLVLPCIQLILLGYAIDFDVRHVPTAVVDDSLSRESRELVDKLQSTQYVEVTHYCTSRSEALRLLDCGTCKVIVLIPSDYQRTLQSQVLVDGSDGQVSQRVVAGVRNLFTEERFRNSQILKRVPTTNACILYNPAAKTNVFMLPGLIGMILQIIAIVLTALSIVKEKEQGTMEQVTVSPVSVMGMMFGKIVPYAVLALFEVQIILYAAWLLFDLHISGSWLQLMIMTVPFLLTTLALGLLIILRGVIIRGVGIMELWKPTLVLLGMAAVLVKISVHQFLRKLG